MDTLVYEPGTIVLFEEGEYSDFGYCGQVVTLQKLNLREAAEEYKAGFVKADHWSSASPSGFVAWLLTTQRCAPLECQTAYLGSYGELNLS